MHLETTSITSIYVLTTEDSGEVGAFGFFFHSTPPGIPARSLNRSLNRILYLGRSIALLRRVDIRRALSNNRR